MLSLIPNIIDILISSPVRSAVSTKSPAHLPDKIACLSLHLFIHNTIILSLCLSLYLCCISVLSCLRVFAVCRISGFSLAIWYCI